MEYAQVILPVPVDGTFTYAVPDAMVSRASPGHRLLVPFGIRKMYTGVVESISTVPPRGSFDLKEPLMTLDAAPILRHPQLKFWRWMADYYLCTLGEVYEAAVPAGLKLQSETVVELNPDADLSMQEKLTERQQRLYDFIRSRGKVSAKTVKSETTLEQVEAAMTVLVNLGLVVVSERVTERFKARKETYVSCLLDENDREAVAAAFATLKRSQRRQEALLALLDLTRGAGSEVSRQALMERGSFTWDHVKALAENGFARISSREVSRFTYSGPPAGQLPELSEAQTQALRQIHTSFLDHDVTLLHGVTASGKTELYIHLIDYVLRRGDQALFLVPEIALTTQLTTRLQRVFGDKVIIYHSKFTDAERVEIWQRMVSSNAPCVVIGARSAVFLPYARLGLVIVDEEHEPGYKQVDPAPRYNARDSATMLARMHGAKTLLGSATPSIETYYKATTGRYGLVTLTERYAGAQLPQVQIVDMSRERKRGATTGNFSDTTLSEAQRSLNEGRQVIFFHNRRGYSPIARCKLCAYVPKCDHCDVSLTYHRYSNRLECHYCGTVYPMPALCPSCHEPGIEIVGYGTERIEDDVTRYFSGRRILRMDLDTTRNKNAYSDIIDSFSAGKADILVGTQMVTKGLDFRGVALVGILNADALLRYPDFRASERAFNMISQVAGRAGRDNQTPGKVIIQTYEPKHPVITFAAAHNYQGYYEHELEERRAFSYPPFSRIINVFVKHRDSATAEKNANLLGEHLRRLFGNRVQGPITPAVSRIKNMHIRRLMIKIEPQASLAAVKYHLRQLYATLHATEEGRSLTVYYDVDPM
ncbi:MAG: primosomal protein N' [Muribaculaceae bacterium]|nr:primosomal protein N' [Muribaculaceae bacterium]